MDTKCEIKFTKRTFEDEKIEEMINGDLRIIEAQQHDEKNYNPDAFKELEKKFKHEKKLLENIEFENAQDEFVFNNLPLTEGQKVELLVGMIKEDNKCISVTDEVKQEVIKLTD